jgi:hypothetical protein
MLCQAERDEPAQARLHELLVVTPIPARIEAQLGRDQVGAGQVEIGAEPGAERHAPSDRDAAAVEVEVVFAMIAAKEERIGVPGGELEADVGVAAAAAPGGGVHAARARDAERRERQALDVVGHVHEAHAGSPHPARHVDEPDLQPVDVAAHVHERQLQALDARGAIECERALHALHAAEREVRAACQLHALDVAARLIEEPAELHAARLARDEVRQKPHLEAAHGAGRRAVTADHVHAADLPAVDAPHAAIEQVQIEAGGDLRVPVVCGERIEHAERRAPALRLASFWRRCRRWGLGPLGCGRLGLGQQPRHLLARQIAGEHHRVALDGR